MLVVSHSKTVFSIAKSNERYQNIGFEFTVCSWVFNLLIDQHDFNLPSEHEISLYRPFTDRSVWVFNLPSGHELPFEWFQFTDLLCKGMEIETHVNVPRHLSYYGGDAIISFNLPPKECQFTVPNFQFTIPKTMWFQQGPVHWNHMVFGMVNWNYGTVNWNRKALLDSKLKL